MANLIQRAATMAFYFVAYPPCKIDNTTELSSNLQNKQPKFKIRSPQSPVTHYEPVSIYERDNKSAQMFNFP